MYNNISCVKQPKNLRVKLFNHQLASIYNMEKLEREKVVEGINCVKKTQFGINADITGYGKTLSMVALILRDKMEWDIYTPYVDENINTNSSGLIKNITIQRFEKLPCTLIIVSSSIIKQWKNEISKTNLYTKFIVSKSDVEKAMIENYDVIVIIPSLYNILIKCYNNYAWKRVIFDEPCHNVINNMKDIKTGFLWFVTATPELIKSNYNQKNNFISKLMGKKLFEEYFIGMIIKNDEDFIKKSYNMPETKYIYHRYLEPILKTVKGIANSKITNLLEAGNIKEAVRLLGGIETDNIIELIKRKKLEQIETIISKIKIYELRNDEKKIIFWKEKKDRIEESIKDLENRFTEMLSGRCNICFDNIESPIMEPYCQNIFCGNCLLTWLKKNNSCPLCRNSIDNKDLIYINNNKNSKIKKTNLMTKNEKILDILIHKEGKFLLFSEYDETFISLSKILEEKKQNYSFLKGNLVQKQNIISNYKNGKTKIIFLNSNFNGAGLNLEETTDIIFYHSMSEFKIQQNIGRANRIGRTESLTVHYFISE